jgi:hypothetical protein
MNEFSIYENFQNEGLNFEFRYLGRTSNAFKSKNYDLMQTLCHQSVHRKS